MKLYHGTSQIRAREIIRDGILPRKITKLKSNFEIVSHPDRVYLTNSYALYFGFGTAHIDHCASAAIIEIEVDKIDPTLLLFDEDVLEQLGRNQDDLPKHWNMEKRTEYYRDMIDSRRHRELSWDISLKAMGTCAYHGSINPMAISRIALVDGSLQTALKWGALDASISLANYQIVGKKYKAMTKWIFDENLTDPREEWEKPMYPWPPSPDRNGIKVFINDQREFLNMGENI